MKTKLERMEDLIAAGHRGELGAVNTRGLPQCSYEDSEGRRCGVGYLLSREMLDSLRDEGLIDDSIDDVFDAVTDDDRFRLLKDCAPFTAEELRTIQEAHDTAFMPTKWVPGAPDAARAFELHMREIAAARMWE